MARNLKAGDRLSEPKEILKHYDANKYRTPDGYTSDIAVFTIISEEVGTHKPPKKKLKLMLIKRADQIVKGTPILKVGNGHFLGDSFNQMKRPMRQQGESLKKKRV